MLSEQLKVDLAEMRARTIKRNMPSFERIKKALEEGQNPTHNKQSTPLHCRNADCDHCECICTTQKCDYFKE